MKAIKDFFKTAIFGGLAVILPVAILLIVFKWLYNFVSGAITPIAKLLSTGGLINSQTAAELIVILIFIGMCFFVGLFVKTRIGLWLYKLSEDLFLRKVPGYSTIKETTLQFFNRGDAPFSSVALAQIFCNDTLVTCFVTDEHPDGSCTVFVPTGPNPTSGQIFHLKAKYVHKVDIPVEATMRSIISCGKGSRALIEEHLRLTAKEEHEAPL
jgi:uncharacterized membrane protein